MQGAGTSQRSTTKSRSLNSRVHRPTQIHLLSSDKRKLTQLELTNNENEREREWMAAIKRNAEKKKETQSKSWSGHTINSTVNLISKKKKNKSKHAQEHPRTGPRSTRNQSPSWKPRAKRGIIIIWRDEEGPRELTCGPPPTIPSHLLADSERLREESTSKGSAFDAEATWRSSELRFPTSRA